MARKWHEDERLWQITSANLARSRLIFTAEVHTIDLRIALISMHYGKENRAMELAKITTRGQITIPAEIRKKLGVKDGDKVIFVEENGRIIIENAAMVALKNAQAAFAGEAERVGLKAEQDVVDMVKGVRREVWEERHARND